MNKSAFWGTLTDKYDKAVQAGMRHLSEKSKQSVSCNKCKKRHPPEQVCTSLRKPSPERGPLIRSNLTLAKVQTRQQINEFVTEAKKVNGPCPVCNRSHTYEKTFSFGKGNVPTRRLSYCSKFLEMSAREHGEFLEQMGGCYHCTDFGHKPDDCRWKLRSGCTEDNLDGSNICGEEHHPLLHNSRVAYCHSMDVQVNEESESENDDI